eukprot:scaffold22429_cov35-Tisochrysis_lutea.AAC.1
MHHLSRMNATLPPVCAGMSPSSLPPDSADSTGLPVFPIRQGSGGVETLLRVSSGSTAACAEYFETQQYSTHGFLSDPSHSAA